MALLNAAFSKRIKNIVDVGYFPILEHHLKPELHLSDKNKRLVKLFVISGCLHMLLKGLKELSYKGEAEPCCDRILETNLVR